MSAFQCSPEHIAAVATYGAASINQAQFIAQLLTEANAASVAYRYQDRIQSHQVSVALIIEYFHSPVNPIEVIKLIASLEYQSCEVPGWEMNHAKAMIDAIQSTALVAGWGDSGTDLETVRADKAYQQAAWSI